MTEFNFATSSYSTGNGECVEVAVNVPGTVAVRDSKESAGPLLWVVPAQWAAFIDAVEHGSFTR